VGIHPNHKVDKKLVNPETRKFIALHHMM